MGNGEELIVETPYYRHFREHLHDVQEHIRGSSHDTLGPSFHPPRGYWTSEEKDKFFHGISVYSRFRPDLIAGDIPTKTILDVCTYLSLLNEASANEKGRKRARDTASAALETSDDWVDFEEQQAQLLIQNEELWSTQVMEHTRKDALHKRVESMLDDCAEGSKPKRSETRKRAKLELQEAWEKEECVKTLSNVHLRVIDSIVKVEEDDDSGLAKPQPQKPTNWEQATSARIPDAMIDPALLAISTPPSSEPPSRGGHSPEPPNASVTALQASIEQHTTHPPPLTAPMHSSPDAESDIDLSTLSPRSRRRHQKRMYMRRKRAEASGRVVSATTSKLKPGRRGKAGPHAQVDDEDIDHGYEIPNNGPTSARNDTGPSSSNIAGAPFTMDEEEDVDDDGIDVYVSKEEYEPTLSAVANLPPTAVMFQQEHRRPHADETLDSSSNTGTSSQRRSKQRGLTLPYKIKAQLNKHGYDAKALRDMGLGLFHLSKFSKLMDLITSVSEGGTTGDAIDICSSISAETVQSLHMHLVAFVTDLMGRVIALREHELQAKLHTKVWRKHEYEVTAPCVRKALQSMNASASKRRRLEDLAARVLASTAQNREEEDVQGTRRRKGTRSASNDGDEDTDDSGIDEDADQVEEEELQSDQCDNDSESLSVFRELYAPFIFGALGIEETESVDISLNTETHRATTKHVELLGSDTDSDAVDAELSEEEELDELDLERSRRTEEALWEEMQVEVENSSDETGDEERREDVGSGVVETTHNNKDITSHFPSRKHRAVTTTSQHVHAKESRSARQLRFAPPDATGLVKSTVYVEDSD